MAEGHDGCLRRGMRDRHIVIVGGGLAGLSVGCYARAAGFRTTILEHNLALGGVCTAWTRGAYTIDGCIHWLTGGSFDRVYEELGILPTVQRRGIDTFVTMRDLGSGRELRVTRDLDALARDFERLGPDDAGAIRSIVEAARAIATLPASLDAPELSTLRDTLARLWEVKGDLGVLMRFRKPLNAWVAEHIKSPALAAALLSLMPPEAPAIALPGFLGYLEHGTLSRPVGGTAAFRDALIATYERLGGVAQLHATVDEILVRGDRAYGVRLADGTIVEADVVVSTASSPETVFRLLGGRYGAKELRKRLAEWKLFDPIVMASFGVKVPLAEVPSLWSIEGFEPIDVGGVTDSRMTVRVCNDDPSFAPPGHAVVQVIARTDYDWWASRGTRYGAEKAAIAKRLLKPLEKLFPGIGAAVEVTDVVTPLTYWNAARSWRGAYEGWLPNAAGLFGHVERTLPGLEGLYLAGQWIEPGGGVPTALASGRKTAQAICAAEGRPFVGFPALKVAPPSTPTRVERGRPVLVLFATREGQTRRIAEHVAATLRARGFEPEVRDARTDAPDTLEPYGAAVVAGSVHVQRHERELVAFVRKHRHALEQMPTAFLSVSLAEAGAEDTAGRPGDREVARAATEGLVRDFFEETGWRADRATPVAGLLAYSQYAAPKRLVMWLIARANHAATDMSKDHEYTDWAALDRFVDGFVSPEI